uniref:ribonuclease H n=1 Tax=Amphiprion ocellaris TaxID=80972 RepID=A0AAQ5ZKW2_AMPOC
MDILQGLGATIYIDDVFIADDTEEEHLEKLQKIIEKLTAAGLKLNLKKCQFGQFQVNYLGFQVATDLGVSEGYREKLDQIRPPTSLKELQQILGLCNYVRDHEPYEWALYTDGSRKGPDSTAYWGFILKQGDKERYRQKGRTEGSAQAGEVTAVLEGLLEMEKRKVKRARIITDSSYCAQALNEDLAIWEENGFETAKGKTVAHRDLWKKIAELRMNMDLEVMHQKAHTKEGDHWKGNDEVDRFSAGSRPHCP